MPYIRRVRVQSPGTHASHITTVQYSATIAGTLTLATPEGVANSIDSGTTFYTHNDRTGAQALVQSRVSPNGRRYITTVANGRETDNLLQLPRF